jgi:uncharacterized repeat protein (TIGR01451 family)
MYTIKSKTIAESGRRWRFGAHFVALLSSAALFISAGCATQQQQSADGSGSTRRSGGSQQQQQQQQPAEAPAPAERPAPAARAAANEGTLKTDLVTITKTAPAAVAMGETFEYIIRFSTQENLDSLVITDKLGEGVSYVRSEPAARTADGGLVWTLSDLDKGASGTLRVWVKAEREGNIINCATVTAVPKVCVTTFVGRAAIGIQKTGPAQAVIGSDVTYNITVRNTGSLPARNVVVTDTVPEGMSHQSGERTLRFNVGDLAANETKQMAVTLKANAKGRHCNIARVTTANAGNADSQACTEVLVPGLKVVKTGDKEQFLSRTARYRIVVSNVGDTTLNNVVVTDTAPAQTAIASATGGSVSGNTATWTIPTLAPGAERAFELTLSSSAPGEHCNSVTVATAEGLRESAQACTVWRGVGALLLEKADNPDPIQVGENTTYTVRVTNQGTADDTNVRVVVRFPEEIDPVSASNGGVVNGKTVTFPPFPRLAAKQAFEYSVVAKGVKVGDARVTFVRTSDGIPAPTSAEESTRVY